MYKKDGQGNVHLRAWGVTFPTKGIDFLGRGYNIFLGNPKSDRVGGDMGFQYKVFQTDSSEEKTSSDWQFVVPKNVEVYSRTTCSLTFSSSQVSSSSSLQSTMDKDSSTTTSVGVEASFEGFGASVEASFNGRWSGSSSFNSMSQSLEKRDRTFIFSEAKCSVYEAHIQKSNLPAFSDEFQAAVKKLPTEYNARVYHRFLRDYGTHVLMGGLFGSKYGRVYELTKKSQESLQSQGYSVSESSSIAASLDGGYSGWGADVSAKASYGHDESSSESSSNKQASAFSSATSSERMYSVGALPPADGDAKTWAANTANDEAMPIKYQFMLMSDVMAMLDEKKASHILQAYKDYATYDSRVSQISQETTELGECYVAKTYRNRRYNFPTKSIIAECSEGYELVGGSIYSAANHHSTKGTHSHRLDWRHSLNWAFPTSSQQFVVGSGNPAVDKKTNSSSLGMVGALCCKTSPELKFMTVRKLDTTENAETIGDTRSASIKVKCPPRHRVVSGGVLQMDIEKDRYVEVLTNAAEGDDAWTCRLAWTTSKFNVAPKFACYARCAAFGDKPLHCKAETKTLDGNQGAMLTCGHDYMATGLGWKVLNRKLPIKNARIYHVLSNFHRATKMTGPRAGTFMMGSSRAGMKYEAQLTCCQMNNNDIESSLLSQPEETCHVQEMAENHRDLGCNEGFYLRGFQSSNTNDFRKVNAVCCHEGKQPIRTSCTSKFWDMRESFTMQHLPDGYFMQTVRQVKECFDKNVEVDACSPMGSEEITSCYKENVLGLLSKQDGHFVGCRAGYRLSGMMFSNGLYPSDVHTIKCCEETQGTESSAQELLEDQLADGSEKNHDKYLCTSYDHGDAKEERIDLPMKSLEGMDSYVSNPSNFFFTITANKVYNLRVIAVPENGGEFRFNLMEYSMHLSIVENGISKGEKSLRFADGTSLKDGEVTIWFKYSRGEGKDRARITYGMGSEPLVNEKGHLEWGSSTVPALTKWNGWIKPWSGGSMKVCMI